MQWGHNPVGVAIFSSRYPRVSRSSQPWAGGPNPFGISWQRIDVCNDELKGRGDFYHARSQGFPLPSEGEDKGEGESAIHPQIPAQNLRSCALALFSVLSLFAGNA